MVWGGEGRGFCHTIHEYSALCVVYACVWDVFVCGGGCLLWGWCVWGGGACVCGCGAILMELVLEVTT